MVYIEMGRSDSSARRRRMIYSIPFDDDMWMRCVDHYFDHIHWEQVEQRYRKPGDWVLDVYDANVNLETRLIEFKSQSKRNWFVLRWNS